MSRPECRSVSKLTRWWQHFEMSSAMDVINGHLIRSEMNSSPQLTLTWTIWSDLIEILFKWSRNGHSFDHPKFKRFEPKAPLLKKKHVADMTFARWRLQGAAFCCLSLGPVISVCDRQILVCLSLSRQFGSCVCQLVRLCVQRMKRSAFQVNGHFAKNSIKADAYF